MMTTGKPIQCRAAVLWKAKEPYSIENVEIAVPKKGEIRVKMTSTGCCHSDLHLQEGADPNQQYPIILGHEGAGFVESVGEGVTKFKPGDLVVLAFESFCGECAFCLNPNIVMCQKQPRNHLQMDGTARVKARGQDVTQMCTIGSFSEYLVTSQYNAAKVNSKANPNTICLAGCCIPTGYGTAINAGKVTPRSSVAIWGLGGVGMCVVMGCRDSGAAKIIGLDINPKKFDLAKQFGATDCLNPLEVKNVPETLAEMTNGGPEVCFVAVGSIPVMEEAFNSSNPYCGKTVIIGITEMGATMKAGIWEVILGRQLIGTFYGSYKAVRDIPGLVDKVVSGKIPLEKLISHKLPLDQINKGFELLKKGEALRAIIDFDLKE